MAVQKLTGADAFVVVDLDGASTADGVVRWAKKVLVDGASNLARSRTYAWALLGEQVSGASAGINSTPEGRDEAISAFVAELTPQVASGELSLDPAKGVGLDDLAPWREVDRRSSLLRTDPETQHRLLAAGVTAAAAGAVSGLDGRTVVIEGAGPATEAIRASFVEAGATVAASDTDHTSDEVLATTADVLACGSKVGLVDHEVADALPQSCIVPVGPLPVTARGLAVARRRNIVVLPDFLTTAGPLLGFRAGPDATAESVHDAVVERLGTLAAELADHEDGPLLGACYRAEQFLSTWRDELPFGRPLA